MMVVRRECVPDYVRAHGQSDLWPSIVEACQDAGVMNYRGFIGGPEGNLVFAEFECVDAEETMARLGRDPRNHEWQAVMAPLMELTGGFDEAGLSYLTPVFSINDQADPQVDGATSP
jgi:L-rhamnose mutarotase